MWRGGRPVRPTAALWSTSSVTPQLHGCPRGQANRRHGEHRRKSSHAFRPGNANPAGSRPRVCSRPDLTQCMHGDQCVDLRCRDRGMSEQLLNHPDIRPTFEQMGGERVPQRVRRHRRCHTGTVSRVLQHLPGTLPRQSATARVQEDRRCSTATSGELRTTSDQVSIEGGDRGRPIGTSRCLPPLPRSSTERASVSTSSMSRPTASEIRAPVEYSSSSNARLRRLSGPSDGSSPPAPSRVPAPHQSQAFRQSAGRRRRLDRPRDIEIDDSFRRGEAVKSRTAMTARAADTAERPTTPFSGSPRRRLRGNRSRRSP